MIFNFKNTTRLLSKNKTDNILQNLSLFLFIVVLCNIFFHYIYIYISDKCKNLTIVDTGCPALSDKK